MVQLQDTWMLSYGLSADVCLLHMPTLQTQLEEVHEVFSVELLTEVANLNHHPHTFLNAYGQLSVPFRGGVLKLTQTYELTVAGVLQAMKMHRLRRDVQMTGIEQLLWLIELKNLSLLHIRVTDYDHMASSVFGPVEDAVLHVMHTHGDALAQKCCMHLLNMMEWAGFVSTRKSWEQVTPLFVHAMESYPDDAALLKHGCYVLFRGCNAPGHSDVMNARCITAVLGALSRFAEDTDVVYAGFAALTPLFWAHKHGDSTVRGIETVLECMQVQTADLQAQLGVERDTNVITLHAYLDSAKILFAGLDVLCKLLHVDKNPFKQSGVASYKSVFPMLKGFGVVRTAHALLVELGAGIGPWHTFCDDAHTFPELLSI